MKRFISVSACAVASILLCFSTASAESYTLQLDTSKLKSKARQAQSARHVLQATIDTVHSELSTDPTVSKEAVETEMRALSDDDALLLAEAIETGNAELIFGSSGELGGNPDNGEDNSGDDDTNPVIRAIDRYCEFIRQKGDWVGCIAVTMVVLK